NGSVVSVVISYIQSIESKPVIKNCKSWKTHSTVKSRHSFWPGLNIGVITGHDSCGPRAVNDMSPTSQSSVSEPIIGTTRNTGSLQVVCSKVTIDAKVGFDNRGSDLSIDRERSQ